MGSKVPASRVDAFLVKKLIQDLVIDCSNSTQVVISQGSVAGADDGDAIMEAAGDLTVDITVSGLNGLDTGVETIDTWYYIYMIFNPDTDAVASLLSASSITPTLPAGYTAQRLVGAVKNDGSGDFWTFIQKGNKVSYDKQHSLLSAFPASLVFTPLSLVSLVPINISSGFGTYIYMSQPSYNGAETAISLNGVDSNVRLVKGIVSGTPGTAIQSTTMADGIIYRGTTVWYKASKAGSTVSIDINSLILDL